MESLNNLSWMFIANSRPTEGLRLMKQSAAIYDKIIDQIFSIGSKRQRMAFLQFIKSNLHDYLSLVRQYFRSSPEAIASLDLVLRRKAIGAEVLAAQREAVLSGRYPQLEPQLRELRNLRMQIARKALVGPSPTESFDIYLGMHIITQL